MLIPEIRLEYGHIKFDFKLKNNIVVIYGDSGTGKSMFFYVLQTHIDIEWESPLNNTVFLFNENFPFTVPRLRESRELGGRLVVIDNAE